MKALLIFLLFFSLKGFAHPVAFEGSKGVMGYHSEFLSHNQLNYSVRYWWAAGIHHIRRPNLDHRSATLATANFLLHRWNGENYQGNLYVLVGGGQSDLSGVESRGAGFGMLQFDIEDRDYYFLVKHSLLQSSEEREWEQSVIRIGISPYVANAGDIHAWFVLEGQNTRFGPSESIADITPFLRLFYKNLLFEIGQSSIGVTKFNYIAHF